MTYWLSFILGMVQGLSEFLPISSSGHLTLLEHLFHLGSVRQTMLFNLVCHLGTLLAIFFLLWEPLKKICTSKERLFPILLATLPLFPLALVAKQLKGIYNHPAYLGYFFLLTALILFLTSRTQKVSQKRPMKHAAYVGLSQTLALLPGVSRSGTTISCARLLGWSFDEAVQFSFLLAIPTILGATALELLEVLREGAPPNLDLGHYTIGFTASFAFGYVALRWLMKRSAEGKFGYFAWYCLGVGLLSLWLFSLS